MESQALIPEKAQNDIVVPIEEPPLESNLNALSEFCQSMGLADMSKDAIRRLRSAGIAMESLGTTNLTQPTTLATQQALLATLNKVVAKLDKENLPVEAIAALGKTAGYLGEKITRSGQAINDTALENSARTFQPPGRQRRSSFAPGQIIDVTSTKS